MIFLMGEKIIFGLLGINQEFSKYFNLMMLKKERN